MRCGGKEKEEGTVDGVCGGESVVAAHSSSTFLLHNGKHNPGEQS
jgi:hypothetical protein